MDSEPSPYAENQPRENEMKRWPLLALGGAALIGVAACDSRDYEAEIATLETELQDAETRLQEAMASNEELNAQLAELEGAGAEVPEEVQGQLSDAWTTAQRTYDRLGQIQEEPNVDPTRMREAVLVLRTDLQQMMTNLQSAGEDLGVELEQGAGQAGQAPEQAGDAAAGGEAQQPAQ